MRSVPNDVPIHRPSVGAMTITQGSQMPAKIVKPYVYRGTGEDQFPETVEPPAPPKSKGLTVEEYRTRERERAKEVARMKRIAKRRRENKWAREAQARARAAKQFKVEHTPVYLDDLDIEVAAAEAAAKAESVPAPIQMNTWRRSPRPAPGFKPLVGADIDDLLDG